VGEKKKTKKGGKKDKKRGGPPKTTGKREKTHWEKNELCWGENFWGDGKKGRDWFGTSNPNSHREKFAKPWGHEGGRENHVKGACQPEKGGKKKFAGEKRE